VTTVTVHRNVTTVTVHHSVTTVTVHRNVTTVTVHRNVTTVTVHHSVTLINSEFRDKRFTILGFKSQNYIEMCLKERAVSLRIGFIWLGTKLTAWLPRTSIDSRGSVRAGGALLTTSGSFKFSARP